MLLSPADILIEQKNQGSEHPAVNYVKDMLAHRKREPDVELADNPSAVGEIFPVLLPHQIPQGIRQPHLIQIRIIVRQIRGQKIVGVHHKNRRPQQQPENYSSMLFQIIHHSDTLSR